MNKTKTKRAIKQIAAREGISVQEVREEMIKAMNIGLQSPDPNIKAMWSQILCKDGTPTPKELITQMARRIKK